MNSLFFSLGDLKDFVGWCRENGVMQFNSPQASFTCTPKPAEAAKVDSAPQLTTEEQLERELFPG